MHDLMTITAVPLPSHDLAVQVGGTIAEQFETQGKISAIVSYDASLINLISSKRQCWILAAVPGESLGILKKSVPKESFGPVIFTSPAFVGFRRI